MLNEGISLVESKTFWGALFALLAIVANAFHWTCLVAFVSDPASVDQTLQGVTLVVSVLGALLAMFGRIVATKQITSALPSSNGKTLAISPLLVLAFVAGLAPTSCTQQVNLGVSQVVTDINALAATAADPAVQAAVASAKAFGAAAICGGAGATELAQLTSGAFKGAKAVQLTSGAGIVYVALAADCAKIGGTAAVTP